jgi:hypothetical protein
MKREHCIRKRKNGSYYHKVGATAVFSHHSLANHIVPDWLAVSRYAASGYGTRGGEHTLVAGTFSLATGSTSGLGGGGGNGRFLAVADVAATVTWMTRCPLVISTTSGTDEMLEACETCQQKYGVSAEGY